MCDMITVPLVHVGMSLKHEEYSSGPHTVFNSLQDKYMADMDELFSQVDEKRKVSIFSEGCK